MRPAGSSRLRLRPGRGEKIADLVAAGARAGWPRGCQRLRRSTDGLVIVRTFAAWRGDCLKDWTLTEWDARETLGNVSLLRVHRCRDAPAAVHRRDAHDGRGRPAFQVQPEHGEATARAIRHSGSSARTGAAFVLRAARRSVAGRPTLHMSNLGRKTAAISIVSKDMDLLETVRMPSPRVA